MSSRQLSRRGFLGKLVAAAAALALPKPKPHLPVLGDPWAQYTDMVPNVIQWEMRGGIRYNFKVMCIMLPAQPMRGFLHGQA